MEDNDLEVLNTYDFEKITLILKTFITNNENVFVFPDLSANNQRSLLWDAIFFHLQQSKSYEVHHLGLAAIRILSRDKEGIDELITSIRMVILVAKAGLFFFHPCMETEHERDAIVDALKCLCNIIFHSEAARKQCHPLLMPEKLMTRMKTYKDMWCKNDLMLYDVKLVYIITALIPSMRQDIKERFQGMEQLTDLIDDLLVEAVQSSDSCGANNDGDKQIMLNDQQQAIICEILKAQFNLTTYPSYNKFEQSDTCKNLVRLLVALLHAQASSKEKIMELRSKVTNLLTSIDAVCYGGLTSPLEDNSTAKFTYEGFNMVALEGLLQFLQHQLTLATTVDMQNEYLSPILTVLNISAAKCRVHRKYYKNRILPPLRDVVNLPEKGDTLRNGLCGLMTSPDNTVRRLASEFIHILCRQKASRVIKYTGFGNAAGLLARKGLIGTNHDSQYSSSSDNSDTEEYLEARHNIDPVVGCKRPPPSNPFEGMSEEQKEYEAMKLVNLFDKMISGGVVSPARVGPDGRPHPVEHVMALQEHTLHPPNP